MFEIIAPVAIGIVVLTVIIALFLRRVVDPNEVHVVQSARGRRSYGKNGEKNTYYEFPVFIPIIGLVKRVLPVSVFDMSLKAYDGYDIDRVPFVVDIIAFFRIEDTDLASQRVQTFSELQDQLLKIMQGAVRTVLASEKMDTIMLERSTFGKKFTDEVESQLREWGVVTVKNMELLDIQDARDSSVIHNIMAKSKSFIEMESRTEVSKNNKDAEIAEIKNAREADVAGQVARQEVAERKAEADKGIGIADEIAKQEIKEQEKTTKMKEMAVLQVEEVRKADIRKEVDVVNAKQQQETTVIVAQGNLDAQKKDAEAIKAIGEAKADAEKQMLLAPVSAEITLAEKIAELTSYQDYLVNIKLVDANKEVGIATAKSLEDAELKVIANSGDVTGGVNNLMDLFSSKGGTGLGASLEALANTDHGKALMKKFGVTEEQVKKTTSRNADVKTPTASKT